MASVAVVFLQGQFGAQQTTFAFRDPSSGPSKILTLWHTGRKGQRNEIFECKENQKVHKKQQQPVMRIKSKSVLHMRPKSLCGLHHLSVMSMCFLFYPHLTFTCGLAQNLLFKSLKVGSYLLSPYNACVILNKLQSCNTCLLHQPLATLCGLCLMGGLTKHLEGNQSGKSCHRLLCTLSTPKA